MSWTHLKPGNEKLWTPGEYLLTYFCKTLGLDSAKHRHIPGFIKSHLEEKCQCENAECKSGLSFTKR